MKKRLIDKLTLQKELRCTPKDIAIWVGEGMPIHDGKFDLEECQHWHRIGWYEQRNGVSV